MPSDEDNLLASVSFLERLLQTKPVQSRHPDIQDQTDRAHKSFPGKVILGRSERFRRVTGGLEQAPQATTN
jgi:hypothetical protein